MNNIMQKLINYWVASAEHDLDTAKVLWRAKRYDACLFFCHLIIEKALKAAAVKQIKDNPPRIHDLVRLSKLAGIKLDERQKVMLTDMNTFNIAGRYPEEKIVFHKKATKTYGQPFYRFTREFYLWIKKNHL